MFAHAIATSPLALRRPAVGASAATEGRAQRASKAQARPQPLKARRTLKVSCVETEVSGSEGFSRRAFGMAAAIIPATQAASAVAKVEAPTCPGEYQTAPSGLQWCDVREGTGDEPVKGETISAHYTGKLASNGFKFDSSYDRGTPLKFQVGVGRVIKGWDDGIIGAEGIPPMKAGGLRKLIIPSDLAYGKRGAGGGLIPPDSVLTFDVELIRRSQFR